MKGTKITNDQNLTNAKKLLDSMLSPLNKEDKKCLLLLLLEITEDKQP